MSKWSERYSAVVRATRHGVLKKAAEVKCERCGAPSTHRHHEDYSKPLEVVYLCKKCHIARHKELGWGTNGRPLHYNFSRIPVGSFALVKAKCIENVSTNVHNHSVLTGEKFKCFRYDDTHFAVFHLPPTAKRQQLKEAA